MAHLPIEGITLLGAIFLLLIHFEVSNTELQNPPKGKLLIPMKHQKDTTHTFFALQTSTTYPFCLAGAFSTNICARRRARRKRGSLDLEVRRANIGNTEGGAPDTKLESTMLGEDTAVDNQKNPRLYQVTVWNTASTTTSITILSTDSRTTVSLSILCIPPGGSLPPAC